MEAVRFSFRGTPLALTKVVGEVAWHSRNSRCLSCTWLKPGGEKERCSSSPVGFHTVCTNTLGGGGRGSSLACRPKTRFRLGFGSRVSNKGAAEAGLQVLVAGRARHALHSPDTGEGSRAEGKPPWGDQVLELRLAGNTVPGEKIVPEAARGVLIRKQAAAGEYGRTDTS